ncbi:MAG: hypothetical protein H7Z40_10865 [Phycisphaerae bacterium]|nr:hypothetical protein [Gemmatimonadaceae bacterium]
MKRTEDKSILSIIAAVFVCSLAGCASVTPAQYDANDLFALSKTYNGGDGGDGGGSGGDGSGSY